MEKQLGALASLLCVCWALEAANPMPAPVDQYNVVWDSPSTDHHGSMPFGNGDVALNAWMTSNGELHAYISKTDAWEDNARLVKVGKIRIRFKPNPILDGAFRQELKLNEGCIEITAGEVAKTRIRVWVDANQPVVHVTAESPAPVEATAIIDLWRTNRQALGELQISDIMMNRPGGDKQHTFTTIEPDIVLTNQRDRIGWFHHNTKSVGPQLLAEVQGLTGFQQVDPLLHRTFGAVITAANGRRLDDLHLHSPRASSHQFNIFVLTRHPSTPEQWLADMDHTIRRVEAQRFTDRCAAHAQWWEAFWNRSWIRAFTSTNALAAAGSMIHDNKHPVRLGADQGGGNQFAGEIGRLTIFEKAVSEKEIAAIADSGRRTAPGSELFQAASDRDAAPAPPLFAGTNLPPQILSNSAQWSFSSGLSIEAWIKPRKLGGGGARIVDKITPGGSDGFLFDTFPGNSLRFICGETILQKADVLPPEQWTHVAAVADPTAGSCRLYVNGRLVARSENAAVRDEAAYVSQMYHLQRFITACAGRGAYPIKFNGSLFTVPPGATEKDPDYRRWGPGYWWQNTRLPYISLCASGDFDLQKPLFRMYVDELLPLSKYRTKLYLGHEGAFYPECIMFWGAVFSETYGWTPFSQRADKLQESGWHKWEWVGGLEIAWMALDYFQHTGDMGFLNNTALPFTREVLTFFNHHYPTNAQGKLVMHPSQALETWWRCTNAMPELAGCIALADRLLSLPAKLVSESDRTFYKRFQAKLPPIPLREVQSKKALAPAEFFAQKSNIENPELYPVFPFRLFAFNRPNSDWAITALEHRWDRGHAGWRQDDIFMAYLGLAEDARKAIVSRARTSDRGERFLAFWGPNYDWTPDQDHGGVLMKTFQAMLMQTDGPRIFLLPAWPKGWNAEFKLHAPLQTVLTGRVVNGKVVALEVTPPQRRADVAIQSP